jgi:hypothetical protein
MFSFKFLVDKHHISQNFKIPFMGIEIDFVRKF